MGVKKLFQIFVKQFRTRNGPSRKMILKNRVIICDKEGRVKQLWVHCRAKELMRLNLNVLVTNKCIVLCSSAKFWYEKLKKVSLLIEVYNKTLTMGLSTPIIHTITVA